MNKDKPRLRSNTGQREESTKKKRSILRILVGLVLTIVFILFLLLLYVLSRLSVDTLHK